MELNEHTRTLGIDPSDCKGHYDVGRVESGGIFASMIVRVVEAIIPLHITYSPRMKMRIIISHRFSQDKLNMKERELKTYVMSALIVPDKRHLHILRFNMHPFQRLLHLVIHTHAMCFSQCAYIFLVPTLSDNFSRKSRSDSETGAT